MININFLVDISTIFVAFVNVVLVIFIFLQFRDSRMPNMTTEIVSNNWDIKRKGSVLETGILYLISTNDSKNVAKKINIEFRFKFRDIEYKSEKKVLSHLNGGETFKLIVYFGEILKKYPGLFEEHKFNNSILISPKEMLKIDLQVILSYNGIVGKLFPKTLEDNYYIEWWEFQEEHKKNYESGSVSTIFSWNKRGDFNIYKTEDVFCLGERET